MVGLPARGKSYLSNRLQRYLRWLEYEVKVFNAGQLRRSKGRAQAEKSGVKEDHSSAFFDANNPAAKARRDELANECLEQLIEWLKTGGGNVGIHDATNSTRARRSQLVKRIARERGMRLIFLESVCTDQTIIDRNIAVKVSSGDPDYDGMDPAQAERDFRERIKQYEKQYETLDPELDADLTYARIVDVGHQCTVNRIDTYLQSRICFYLMNLCVGRLLPRADRPGI